MKKVWGCLAAVGLLGNVAYGANVTLTPADVTSALDIESAIDTATGFGTEAGVVVLDGDPGPFVYTNGDRSINIDVSNLTLRGINGATLSNCADGLFFDPVPIENLLVQGIRFNCTGNGMAWFGLGPRLGVTVQHTVIQAGGWGIVVGDAIDWRIANNIIIGGNAPGLGAIDLVAATGLRIVNNALSGFLGVRLPTDPAVFADQPATANRVVNNHIEAFETGIELVQGASRNRIIGNLMTISGSPGIFLDATTRRNKVQGNQVFLIGVGNLICVEDLGVNNRVSGNCNGP